MNDMVANDRVVKFRVQAVDPEPIAQQMVEALEGMGLEVIEWSKVYPVREDPNLNRIFITAIKE